MTTLSKKAFTELANVVGSRCISIYLPTHRAGQEVNEQQDRILFKNLLAEAEKEMDNRGFGKPETQEFLDPAKALLDDSIFWRYQTEGLAVFLGKNMMRYYHLPMRVQTRCYVSHEFYLQPLMPLFTGNGNFYLLSLNLSEVKFYRGNRETLDEIPVENLVPQRLEEVVGFDYEQRFQGFHSGSGKGAPGTVHGHASWIDDEKDEILQFFRGVDKSLSPLLEGENLPLVVACLDHLFPLYKQANTYPYLFEEIVSGNPEYTKPSDLHHAAWEFMAFHFDRERKERMDLFQQYRDTDRATTDIKEIIPSANGGRIDTLFIEKNAEIWGVYDPRKAEVTVHESQNYSNTSLTNQAAIQVFLNGGRVFLAQQESLPDPYSPMNALYRY